MWKLKKSMFNVKNEYIRYVACRKNFLIAMFSIKYFDFEKTSHLEMLFENSLFYQSNRGMSISNSDSSSSWKELFYNEYMRHNFDKIFKSIDMFCTKTSQTHE